MRMLRLIRLITGTAAFGLAPMLTAAPSAAFAAETSVTLPFDHGQGARIMQGYNGGTHQGASIYGLDLVLANGETSGAPVLAPFDGTIPWAFAPGEKTGCIEVVAQDRKFGAMLCHVVLDRPFQRGERVVRGQQLGAVGAAGMVGNNGSPHVHMELHLGGRSSDIVPFSTANGGVPLDGWDLPATGASNEHAMDGPIMSSNAWAAAPSARTEGAGPPSVTVVTPPKNAPKSAAPVAKGCGAGQTPTFALGFAGLRAHLGDTVGDPTTCEFADPNGSGDVLQQTSRGLAFWRKSSNTPTFTNGNEHWALTSSGWVTWSGSSIDPPTASYQLSAISY
jgi:hypothetical protein